jgi:regulator of sirC expression with transglutaminase-like and TPR domain
MQESLSEKFHKFSQDDAADELQAACLVAQTLEPKLDFRDLQRRLGVLVDDCDNADEPWLYLQEIGFVGNEDDYAAVENSRIDLVVQSKCGIPITLGVVLLHVARQLGHTTHGVNFPGHFLVRIDADLVDPFHMRRTTEAQWLRGSDVSAEEAFASASAQTIALRMLNNLKWNFAGLGNWDLALDILDYQIVIDPAAPQLHLERGEFWVSLGAIGAARHCFEEVVALANPLEPKIAALAKARLAALSEIKEVLH